MNCCRCLIELTENNWLSCKKKLNYKICCNCVRIDNNKRYIKNKEKYLYNYKQTRLNIKKQVFDYYGGKCEICFDTNNLSLDHINKNGRKHRKEILGTDSGSEFYKWVLKNKPDYIRLLCFNCNCQINMTIINLIKQYDNNCKYCGKNIYKNKQCNNCYQTNKRNNFIKLKLEVFAHYGNKCSCGVEKIEFLTIDHINNDGSEHRKSIGNIFPWLKRNKYPEGFQVLCFNCNIAKKPIK